jgi:hypothetical protein
VVGSRARLLIRPIASVGQGCAIAAAILILLAVVAGLIIAGSKPYSDGGGVSYYNPTSTVAATNPYLNRPPSLSVMAPTAPSEPTSRLAPAPAGSPAKSLDGTY